MNALKTCQKCKGLLIVDRDKACIHPQFVCLNCGLRVACNQPSYTAPSESGSDSIINVHTKIDDKHGIVLVTAEVTLNGASHKISLRGKRAAWFELSKLSRHIIEKKLLGLFETPRKRKKVHDREIVLKGTVKHLYALSVLKGPRLSLFLGNLFADPFSHQKLRDKPTRGRSSNVERVKFWTTARDIASVLQPWIQQATEPDSVLKRVKRVLEKCESLKKASNVHILKYLIDRNWTNAGRSFPDKRALSNQGFNRHLRREPANNAVGSGYIHSRAWHCTNDGISKAIVEGPGARAPVGKRARLLAEKIMSGGYIIRAATNVIISTSL